MQVSREVGRNPGQCSRGTDQSRARLPEAVSDVLHRIIEVESEARKELGAGESTMIRRADPVVKVYNQLQFTLDV
jgi:hypothetical protein